MRSAHDDSAEETNIRTIIEPAGCTVSTGVILAAGKGVRAYPVTKMMPKALLEIGEQPLVSRNIEIMRDQLKIAKIIIVIGHYGDQIVEHFRKNPMGVDLLFVTQHEQKGIGHALLGVEEHVGREMFLVMLADEFYLDSNHCELPAFLSDHSDADAVLLFREEMDKNKIRSNYTGTLADGRVVSLIEKPAEPDSRLLGVGSYLLNKKVFDYIRNSPPSPLRGEVEITEVLSSMAQKERVYAAKLRGFYINVNSLDDLNYANYIYRDKFFDSYKITVVIPAHNEEETIQEVVDEYARHPAVDEVLVIDNNSSDGTNRLAAAAGARVLHEPLQGYGRALKRGLDEASGDIVVLTEADGSFRSEDIPKLLEYLKDCDMAVGTRTTRQMIEQGANMGPVGRWANVVGGKIIESLWWGQEPRFTDVCCTYRAVWKNSYRKIRPYVTANGLEFATEMMIAMLISKKRIIEIPVSYRKRFWRKSRSEKSPWGRIKTAWRIMSIIFRNRFLSRQ